VDYLRPETGLPTTRRAVLLAGAGGAGMAVLAACSTAGGDSSGGAPASQSAGETLVTLADITIGRCVAVTLPDGGPAVVARPTAEGAVCFSAVCTHLGCTVAPNGAKLNCPCHGSQFSALTGKVLQGPASQALPRIPVTVRNGKVVTA
jgi:Rieske Fe-S protein